MRIPDSQAFIMIFIMAAAIGYLWGQRGISEQYVIRIQIYITEEILSRGIMLSHMAARLQL